MCVCGLVCVFFVGNSDSDCVSEVFSVCVCLVCVCVVERERESVWESVVVCVFDVAVGNGDEMSGRGQFSWSGRGRSVGGVT